MKDGLRKLVSEWPNSLHFSGDSYWKMSSGADPIKFFSSLPIIFPYGGSLLFEGLEISLTAKSLYEEFPAQYVRKVACDILDPTPDSFHVSFESDFVDRLCRIIAQQGVAAAFHHFKGYSESELIFSFHTFKDSFETDVVVSETVGEKAIEKFSAEIGQFAETAQFPPKRSDKLKQIDNVLNPSWARKLRNLFGKE